MFVVLLPNVFHTNDMFALSEKSAEKKTKTGRLPIAHYKQKPAGSDLWPVNRCIPSSYQHLSVCTVADLTNRRGKQPLRVPGNHGPHLIFAKHTWCYGEGQMFTHHSKWRVFVRCGVLQACESSHYNTM